MNTAKWLSLLVVVELVASVGDYFIKKASLDQQFVGWKYLVLAGLFYAVTVVGWFFMMRWFKMVTLGYLHAFGDIILSILMGLVLFQEKVTPKEIIGIILGLIAVFLLAGSEE